jgi:ABC-type phosphate transport system substrate-binding protein
MKRIALIVTALAWFAAGDIAMADVVAVVSAKSPVTTLSKNQLLDIFLGRANRYPDGTTALPLDQVEGSAERDEFYNKLAGMTANQIKAYWSKIIFTGRGQPPPTVANDVEMKKRITENPAAIGYIDRAAVDDSVRIVF